MTIHIEKETTISLGMDENKIIELVVNAAMDYEGCPYEAEVDVLLTDDASIQEINKEQRGIDAPTDVLSFPFVEYESPAGFSEISECSDCFHPETGELLLGDIVVSLEHVISQAEEYGHSRERELGFLIAHSMLHLFGYDHMQDGEREVMEARQRKILEGIGLKR